MNDLLPLLLATLTLPGAFLLAIICWLALSLSRHALHVSHSAPRVWSVQQYLPRQAEA